MSDRDSGILHINAYHLMIENRLFRIISQIQLYILDNVGMLEYNKNKNK
jgi:hypothetical protein